MSQVNLEVSNTSPAIVFASKMTYEEFLREYDGQYAEYVDGDIIKDISVTDKHEDINSFLKAL